MLKKDGSVFWAQLAASAAQDFDGAPVVRVVLSDAPERKRMEAELRQSELALAAQGERQQLARDLHDAVSQTLFSARLIAETLLRQKETVSTEMLWSNLGHITRLVVSALGEMRILLLEMRPEGLVNAELSSLLTHLVDASASRTEASIIPTIQAGARLPLEVKIAFYRIAQEAINNTIKHANATEINLALTRDDFGVQLVIKDNGRGFNLQKFSDDRFGVRIMAERANKVRAVLQIDSRPNLGTCVTCRWPQNGSKHG